MSGPDRDRIARAYPVIEELPADLAGRLEESARPVAAAAGQRLFDEGNSCAVYPLLVRGTIRATKCGPDGHEILLYRLKPGESCVITVVALLGGTPYPAIGTAETDLLFFGVPRALFVDLILKSPPFRSFVFGSLSQRMALLMALIDDVAFRRVDQRLASRLLHEEAIATTTHQRLAEELGTTREVISRTLETFQDSGILRLGRGRIEILDRAALARVHRDEAR